MNTHSNKTISLVVFLTIVGLLLLPVAYAQVVPPIKPTINYFSVMPGPSGTMNKFSITTGITDSVPVASGSVSILVNQPRKEIYHAVTNFANPSAGETIEVFDMKTMQSKGSFGFFQGYSNFMGLFSPDGQRLVYSLKDSTAPTLMIMVNLATQIPVWATATTGISGSRHMAFSPDGSTVGLLEGGELRVYNSTNGAQQTLVSVDPNPFGSYALASTTNGYWWLYQPDPFTAGIVNFGVMPVSSFTGFTLPPGSATQLKANKTGTEVAALVSKNAVTTNSTVVILNEGGVTCTLPITANLQHIEYGKSGKLYVKALTLAAPFQQSMIIIDPASCAVLNTIAFPAQVKSGGDLVTPDELYAIGNGNGVHYKMNLQTGAVTTHTGPTSFGFVIGQHK